jgi:hypothetical protein
MSMWNETLRLGTELEVVADFELTALLERFRPQDAVLRSSDDAGRHTLWLELDPTETDLDEAVQRDVAMIEALPGDLRSLWNTTVDRCLNTGIQADGRRTRTLFDSLPSRSRAPRVSVFVINSQYTRHLPRAAHVDGVDDSAALDDADQPVVAGGPGPR